MNRELLYEAKIKIKITDYGCPEIFISNTEWILLENIREDYHVIAIYSNPQGKSEPSNIVNNPGIPIQIEEPVIIPEINISYNPANEFLRIESNEGVIGIKLLNVKGQIIYKEDNISPDLYIGNLAPGIYFVEIIGNNKHICREKIIKK